jgi:hypothetical protein
MLLVGKVPSPGVVRELQEGKRRIGANIFLIQGRDRLKTLCSLQWAREYISGENEYLMGLKFMDMPDEDKGKIKKLIETLQHSGNVFT